MDLLKKFLGITFLLGVIAGPISAAPMRVGHVEAELVSEVSSIAPGQPFTVGLRLKLDDQWHVYWRNPGDAGLPPFVGWELPDGFTASQIRWPVPHKVVTPPLASYAYSHEVILPMTITPPSDLKAGQTITLAGTATWLVCKEECVPGEAELALTLPVASETAPDPTWQPRFASIQYPVPADFPVHATFANKQFEFNFEIPEATRKPELRVEFYAARKGTIDHIGAQPVEVSGTTATLRVNKSEYLLSAPDSVSGLLVFGESEEDQRAYEIHVAVEDGSAVAATTAPETTFWQAILFAFIGGIILNLMPCVLPVLSLKILSFVNHANSEHTKPLYHGLVFSAGVLISFWILAGALLFLKAGGEQLGWGFQLQSPIFLVIVSSFIFLFGLNLLGVFEIGASLTSAGAVAAGRRGFAGSFLNGVTATVVATPCTAPFMGSALGYSLAQPVWIAMLIFTSLGLGMAAPYLVLSASPKLLRFVPKPGRWMETLKQFLGFVLLATVIWLLWVLSIQIGTAGLIFTLAALLLLGLAAWVIGRWDTLVAERRVQLTARAAALALAGLALVIGVSGASFSVSPGAVVNADAGGIAWETFSPQRVDELRTAGKPVFIDFTAAWCLSCQVNEKVAFSATEVQQKFVDLGVVALKADWTLRDQTIAAALAEFGRNSVPLYVLYHSNAEEPIVLPEILTPGIVLNALNQIDSQPGDRSPSRQVTIRGERQKKEPA